MTPTAAQTSIKNANAELFNLTPSAPIVLFEIDTNNLYYSDGTFTNFQTETKLFRFHNNVKLFNTNILWQGNTYYPAPIQTEGFEYSAKGSLPTPKFALSINDPSLPAFVQLKVLLRNLNELVGAKVTRRKTMAKFLDTDNWNVLGGTPAGFSPDPNSEFSPDIYYISRKSADNKNYLEFELTSIIDLDGLKLPGRIVLADRCMAIAYRGEGCLYEYGGSDGQSVNYDVHVHKNGILPPVAPPVANFKDETFNILLNLTIAGGTNPPPYNPALTYNIGDFFYVTKNYNKYYFVVKAVPPPNTPPPNDNYYYADDCSRTVRGCKLRWNQFGQSGPNQGGLMFNGFPSVNKVG